MSAPTAPSSSSCACSTSTRDACLLFCTNRREHRQSSSAGHSMRHVAKRFSAAFSWPTRSSASMYCRHRSAPAEAAGRAVSCSTKVQASVSYGSATMRSSMRGAGSSAGQAHAAAGRVRPSWACRGHRGRGGGEHWPKSSAMVSLRGFRKKTTTTSFHSQIRTASAVPLDSSLWHGSREQLLAVVLVQHLPECGRERGLQGGLAQLCCHRLVVRRAARARCAAAGLGTLVAPARGG